MAEDFITFEAACSYLGVTSGQMYQYTHKKLISYYKPFGKKLYFKKSEINELINASRVAPQEKMLDE